MKNYQHILMATDCQEAIDRVQNLCQAGHSHISLSLVLHKISQLGLVYMLPSLTTQEENRVHLAEEKLSKIGEKLGVPKNEQWVDLGSPADVISKKAEEIGADLIVVDKDEKHFLSSNITALAHKASCDILAIKSKENHTN